MRCRGVRPSACASIRWARRGSQRPRSGTRSAATNSCRTMAFTICASPPSSGRSTTTITCALMTVDHPAGTEIFVDERFVIPPAKLAITSVATPHPIARAIDDTGQDVTEIVSDSRRKIPRQFRPRPVSGSNPRSLCRGGPGRRCADKRSALPDCAGLDASDTDSSVNVAISAGTATGRLTGLSLEVPDGRGGWVTCAETNLGFPAGRKKTMLVRSDQCLSPRHSAPGAPAHES